MINMNYFELLLCKYTWFWTKVSGYKKADYSQFLKAVYSVILLIYCWPIAPLIVFWTDKMISLKYVIAIFYVATAVAVNFYYDKIRKTRRIVYNIDYMRSRKGIVMAILLALLSIGNLIAWPLISYYIRNGLI